MRALLIAALLAIPAPASGQMVEARELLRWCADGTPAGSAACTAYIAGIADSVGSEACPEGQSREKVREAVVREMMAIQAQLLVDFQAVAPVTTALQKAFPCPR